LLLRPADGFDQDQFASKGNESDEVQGGFLAPQSNPLEPLELADRLLDPRQSFVEPFREEAGLVLGIQAVRDHRDTALFAAGGAVFLRVVALVGQ
jgi:hypothetical protein